MSAAVYASFVIRYVVILALTMTSLMGCAYNETARIEGVVLNARTKMPVSQGVVRMIWAGSDPALVDTTITVFHSETAITDKEGRYIIPKYWFLKPFYRHLEDMTLSVFHPLYTSWEKNWIWSPNRDREKSYLYLMNNYGKDGVIHYDIDLVQIEDRFAKKEDKNDFSAFLSGKQPEYWAELKNRYGVRYDLQEIEDSYARLKAKLIPEIYSGDTIIYRKFLDAIQEVKRGGY